MIFRVASKEKRRVNTKLIQYMVPAIDSKVCNQETKYIHVHVCIFIYVCSIISTRYTYLVHIDLGHIITI